MANLPIVDKIAVIFHGIVGGIAGRNGIGATINLPDCAKIFKYNVMSAYDCDVFVHSWSVEHKDMIISLYNPKKYLFQPQEMFGYNLSGQAFGDEHRTHEFRTVSRYNSLERSMALKSQYEIENNIRYKWVLVVRFDLVFFTRLNLSSLDPSCFYICSEPHWPDINKLGLIHDVVFLSGADVMDAYNVVTQEIRAGKYNDTLHATHVISYRKLKGMFNGNMNKVGYAFRRYHDMEIYRFIVDPAQNPVGHAYGALETKSRLDSLLKIIG